MPLQTATANTRARAALINANFALCVLTDTARTIAVTHTWTASQAFSGGLTAGAPITVTDTTSAALSVGRQGATNPVLQVDASATSVVTGLKITGAAAAGGVALTAISSGTNENLTIDAKGSGTITLNATGTGGITLARATTISAALTYGGVTLSNAVTGTGAMVLSASPTFTGTVNAAAITATSTIATGMAAAIGWSGASLLVNVSDGVVKITNNAGTTGSLTANVTGNVTGNASTATALQTARAINGVSFDGTAAITVTAAAGTLTGATLNSTVTASSLTSVGTLSSLAVSGAVTGGTYNGQTISSAASFTGTATVAGGLTVSAGTTAVQALTATTAAFSDNVTITKAGTTSLTLRRSGSATGSAYTDYGNTVGRWATGVNIAGAANAFEVYNSGLGATAISIAEATNVVTFAAGITATTGTFSGLITRTGAAATGTQGMTFGGTTTGYHYMNMTNTGANLVFGIEASTGNTIFAGSSAYAAGLKTGNATDLCFGTNDLVRLTLNGTTGSATFTAGISATTGTFSSDIIIAATAKVRLDGSGSGDSYIYEAVGNQITVVTGGTGATSFTASGLTTIQVNGITAATPTPTASQTDIGNTTQTTVGGAGGASALPATPVGYWAININGTRRAIPYYLIS